MFLNFLNYTSYFANLLFVGLLIRTFRHYTVKQFWLYAKEKVKSITLLKNEIRKAEARGESPFVIPGTNVTIYAKSMNGAMYKYKKRQREFKNKLKKQSQKVS